MHRSLYAFAFLAVALTAQAQAPAPTVRQVGTARLENVPEIPAQVSAAVQRYQNDRAAIFEDWLPDGSMLIATRFGASQQIHRVTAPGGARTQLTFFTEPVAAAFTIPGTERFVFVRDNGGDEWFQLYSLGLTGEPTLLTEPGTRNEAPVFSDDGKLVVWSRAMKDSSEYAILSADPAAPKSARVVYRTRRLGGADRRCARQIEGAADAEYFQSRVESVSCSSWLRARRRRSPRGRAGAVRRSEIFARRPQRFRDFEPGERCSQTRRDRHRERQGDSAHAGSQVERRTIRADGRRPRAGLRDQRGRLFARRRARSGHAARVAAAGDAARRRDRHAFLA